MEKSEREEVTADDRATEVGSEKAAEQARQNLPLSAPYSCAGPSFC